MTHGYITSACADAGVPIMYTWAHSSINVTTPARAATVLISLVVLAYVCWSVKSEGRAPPPTLVGDNTIRLKPAKGESCGLVAAPCEFDVGRVSGGTRRELGFWLRNESNSEVQIGDIEVSCDCLRVVVGQKRLQAGECSPCRAYVDLSHEPDFRGTLVLEAHSRLIGSTKAATCLARIRVNVTD